MTTMKPLVCAHRNAASFLLALTTALAQPLAVQPVQGNVQMIYAGAAGNIAVQTGRDGILVVDALSRNLAPAALAEIRKLSSLPMRMIINTSMDASKTGGNATLAAGGMFALSNGGSPGATILAHENVLNRMTQPAANGQTPPADPGVPTSEYFLPQRDFYFNGEPVFVMHQPHAITDGDSIVLFRKSDTIAVGDLYTVGRYPPLDVARGGSIQGLIDALNRVLDLAVPERLQDGGTRIIPGRGRVTNEADLVEFRDMVVIIRDRVRDMVKKRMTLDQVLSAKLSRDYDPEYGDGQAFVTQIYRSLTAAAASAK
jgi:cyclase